MGHCRPAGRARPWLLAAALVVAVAACSGGDSGPAADVDSDAGDTRLGDAGDADTAVAVDSASDVPIETDGSTDSDASDGSGDAEADTGPPGPRDGRVGFGAYPETLPFEYERDPVGDPVDGEELRAFTERYLTLLDDIRYFHAVDDRVHGVPESDPEGRYWYGSWWSGVRVVRHGDTLTFRHPDDGSDNNGLRTAQLLESACFATALWGRAEDERLTREMVRGFTSWALAFERESAPGADVVLARASYPASITVERGEVEWTIDYDANRPGVDADPSQYVFVPDNPYWADLWVKNIRSKDDIGHMFRAVASLAACADALSEEGRAEVDELLWRYFAWARRVEDDGNRIVTYDADLEPYFPSSDLAVYIDLPGVECPGRLLVRLAGRAYTGGVDCGDGIGAADLLLAQQKNGTAQILRSHHAAAAMHALLADRADVAEPLVHGLAERIDWFVEGFAAGERPYNLDDKDFAAHILHAAIAGVPLTAREVRWLHSRFDAADASLRALPAYTWDLFGPDVPDGEHPYEPGAVGIAFNDLGLALGVCASPWANPSGEPLLDCPVVRDWMSR